MRLNSTNLNLYGYVHFWSEMHAVNARFFTPDQLRNASITQKR